MTMPVVHSVRLSCLQQPASQIPVYKSRGVPVAVGMRDFSHGPLTMMFPDHLSTRNMRHDVLAKTSEA